MDLPDMPEPPDDDDGDDEEHELEELIESLIDDFALLEDDDLIAIVPIEETWVMPPDDLPQVSGEDMIWASEQVLGTIEEDQEQITAEYQAALAQGRLDALATGCPPDQVEGMGFGLATYPRVLNQLAEAECHLALGRAHPPAVDTDDRAMSNKVDRTFTTLRAGLVRVAVVMAQGMNRTDEMIEADVVAARRKGRSDAKRVVQLAIAHSRGET